MIKEVDDDLLRREGQMAEHLALEQQIVASSAGEMNSGNSITPSESVSVSVRQRIEQEAAATAETMEDDRDSRKLGKMREFSHCHLSGSDLDPHPLLMKRSCLIVEAWLEKCDAAAATGQEQDLDSDSAVFILRGFHERPQPDVEVWHRPLRNRESLPAGFTPRGRDDSTHHHRQQTDYEPSLRNADHGSDLDFDPDSPINDNMSIKASPRRKIKFAEKLFSALRPKKPKSWDRNHGTQRRVRFEEETRPQRHRAKREKSKMGERESMVEEDGYRTSVISHYDANLHRSMDIDAISATSSSNETTENVDKEIESDLSVLSSRDSEMNLGSIMGQPASPPSAYLSTESLPLPQENLEFQPSPPKPNSPWLDSRYRARIGETPHGKATSSSASHRIETLPPGVTSIVPTVYPTEKPSKSDFDKNREERRAERNAITPVLLPEMINFVHHKETGRRIATPEARDLKDRRAQRGLKSSGTENYRTDERKRLWSLERA